MSVPQITKRYVISFLGIKPQETTYQRPALWKNVHGGAVQHQTIDTSYAPYAVHVLSEATRSFVICTEEAAKIYDGMSARYADTYMFVRSSTHEDAPTADFVMVGKEDGNINDIFGLIDTIITINNAPDVEWLFDITGGLRSIPFTVSAVLEYLSVLIDLRVYDICYARYGDTTEIESVNIQRTYILWARATEAFVRYGHADQLIELFAQLPLEQGGAIDYLNTIRNTVDALYTAKFNDLSDAAGKLLSMLQTVRHKPFFLGEYEPFAKFLQHISQEYQVFVIRNDDADAELKRLSHIIGWYLNHKMWAQAIISSHEALISVAMHYFGKKEDTRNQWENVGIGCFTNAENTDLYVLWANTSDNPINKQKMGHIYIDNSPFNGGYNRDDITTGIQDNQLYGPIKDIVNKLMEQSKVRQYSPIDGRRKYFEQWCKEQKNICTVIELFFTSQNHRFINDITRLLQSMRSGNVVEWIETTTHRYLADLKSYAQSSTEMSRTNLSVCEYEPRLIALFTDFMHRLFESREQLLSDVPVGVELYPIGNEIRKARNGVSHMQGIADIHTIKSLCERLIRIAESMQCQSLV